MSTASRWRQEMCNRVSMRINRGLNGGDCPGAGSLGECPAVYELSSFADGFDAAFAAEVYLHSRAADFAAATLAKWIEDAGGLEPCISLVLHDPYNGTENGLCNDGARHWRAEFLAKCAETHNVELSGHQRPARKDEK